MGDGGAAAGGVDFFVSYTGADEAWAVWVAWQLEDAGFRVLVQAWDFGPGSHFVAEMDSAVQRSVRTVAVLSNAYLGSVFGAPEWQAAWAADPSGSRRKLLVFRVEDCAWPGLLGQVVSVDLFGVGKVVARERVLSAARGGRLKPAVEPAFPAGDAEGGEPVFPPDLPEVWNVPARLAHFTGREGLLDELADGVRAGGSVAVCALAGLGGVGKTALAVEYAHRNAGQFDVVWWVAAENPDLVDPQLGALGARLGLGDGAGPATVLEGLRRRGSRWLLVLDNVENPDVVLPLRPSDGRGRLLVTSRRTEFDGVGVVVSVPTLSRAESVGLLAERLPGLDPLIGNRIAELVGDLALAVEQVAAYLKQTGTPPERYAGLLEGRLPEAMRRGRVADRPGTTVANLWSLSVDRLTADWPAALELLRLLAWCGPEPVPEDLFVDHHGLLDDGPLKESAGDLLAWEDTLGVLRGYSLALRAAGSLTVHRLVQAAVRDGTPSMLRDTAPSVLAQLLRAALPTETDLPASWPRWRNLLPHVLAVLDHLPDTKPDPLGDASWLCTFAGQYLSGLGQVTASIGLFERAAGLDAEHLGLHHADSLASRNNVAYAYESAGRVDEAITLHELTLADRLRVLGPDHPDTLASRNNLANAYDSAGRVDEAITLHELTLAGCLRVVGPDHPDTLGSRNNLAYAYQAAGRIAEAVTLHKQNVADCLRVLGPDHPDTLASRNNLATAYESAGRVDEAITLHELTLADRLRVLGPDHPDTLTSRNNLACSYRSAGRTEDAVTLFEQALADMLRVLGPGHPDTLLSRNNLAGAYWWAGRTEDAVTLFELTLADCLRVLGPNHPHTLTSRHNLATAYRSAGQLNEADSLTTPE